MRIRRRHGIAHPSEPPAALLTDMAFNLLIFFVVIASVDPESGRKQAVPAGQNDPKQAEAAKNVTVSLTRTTATVDGELVEDAELPGKLRALLAAKTNPDDRIVIVKSSKDTSYDQWVRITGVIEKAGGIVTLQVEESGDKP